MAEGQWRILNSPLFEEGVFINLRYKPVVGSLNINLECQDQSDTPLELQIQYSSSSDASEVQNVTVKLKSKKAGRDQQGGRGPLLPLNAQQMTLFFKSSEVDIYTEHKLWHTHKHTADLSTVARLLWLTNGISLRLAIGRELSSYVVGKVVYITARAPEQGSFSLELLSTVGSKSQSSRYSGEQVPFRLAVDVDNNTAALSSTINGTEIASGHDKPLDSAAFKPGTLFCLTIFAEFDGFEVGLNGAHYVFYKYPERVSYSNMAVQLVGLSDIQSIDYH